MNPRERMLAIVLLLLVLVVGVGGMGYVLVLKPLTDLGAQKREVEAQIDKKLQDLDREKAETEKVRKLDPRLALWDKLSLPDASSRDAGEIERHYRQVQVDYEQHVNDVLRRAGVKNLKITTLPVDVKSGAQGPNKPPLYKKLPYKIEGNGTLAAVVQAMDDLHRDPLLHEVRDLTVTRPQTNRPGTNSNELDVRLSLEALIVTGAPARKEEWLGAKGEKYEPKPADKAGTKLDAKDKDKPAAKDKDKDKPAAKPAAPQSPFKPTKLREDWMAVRLASSGDRPVVLSRDRDGYQAILARNIFLGSPGSMGGGRLREQLKDVLDVIKLTSVEKRGTKWIATLTDPAKVEQVTAADEGDMGMGTPNPDKKPPSFKDIKLWIGGLRDKVDFAIEDMHGNVALHGTVVDITKRCLWFHADGRIYRMHGNDTMFEALQRPTVSVNIMLGGLGTAGAPKERN
jgi:hypothetical protein